MEYAVIAGFLAMVGSLIGIYSFIKRGWEEKAKSTMELVESKLQTQQATIDSLGRSLDAVRDICEDNSDTLNEHSNRISQVDIVFVHFDDTMSQLREAVSKLDSTLNSLQVTVSRMDEKIKKDCE